MPPGNSPAQAKIVAEKKGGTFEEFRFPLNPDQIRRDRAPQYADIPIAQGDSWSSDIAQIEWVRNPPEDISIRFILHNSKTDGDVERELFQLDDMLEMDMRTGEPPTVIFIFGPRRSKVRVTRKSVEEKVWQSDGRVVQAMVSMTMRTVGQPRK